MVIHNEKVYPTEILKDVKSGKPIIIIDDEDRENEGDFFVAADVLTRDAVRLMINVGRGLICAPMTQQRANELNLPMMVKENNSPHSTAFTVSVDHISNSTGISLEDRFQTLVNLSNQKAKETDFIKPGHIFPLIANDRDLTKDEVILKFPLIYAKKQV